MAAGGMSSSAHPVDSARDYADLCMRAAQEFIHTIVVVDDRATYGELEAITSLVEPGAVIAAEDSFDEPAGIAPGGASLNVAVLTDASADIGLTCAVLRPREEEQRDGTLHRRLVRAARRADVLVLDWQLNDESDGQAALRLLSDVAQEDKRGQGRLRLVCFYTSHPDLDGVFGAVERHLGEAVLSSSGPGQAYRWIDCGCMRIVVFAKAGGITADIAVPAIALEEDELPQKLVEEFASLTSGLVSNVAVASLAAVRADAHRLLTRFGSSLDEPFLSHRFYEGGPESEELVVRLVADEIKSLLDSADVRRWIEPTAIRHWAQRYLPDQIKLKPKKGERILSKVELVKVLEGGAYYGSAEVTNQVNTGNKFDLGKEYKDSVTEILINEGGDAERLDYEFARLTCLARNDSSPFPGDRSPILTEGSIVRGRNGQQVIYLLCSMPLCDTVRVGAPRAFPFVPLKVVTSADRYNLVALSPEGGQLHLAFAPSNHYDIVRHTFAGDPGGVVRSRRRKVRDREQFVFFDVDEKPWIWVAELRFQHAHRKLNELGAASSRVGLDEAHILRNAGRR
ncbi:response regulator receiver domain [Streptacidiphilus griseoplanus]|uniref:response regulator receiver domain n=1 Tax=Peterkaempfera griseoplana TaxID=66896 RepID=UPI000A4773D6|nr:response regulator receiver domain [Peterkaempfera griseoplana]